MDLVIAFKIHYTKLQSVPNNCRYNEENKNLLKMLGLVQKKRLLLDVEDTVHVTKGHFLTNLLFKLFSSFFCPSVHYCFTSAVSSTPSKSQNNYMETRFKLNFSWLCRPTPRHEDISGSARTVMNR